MKNIENIFLNTKKYLLKETQNAMFIKAPKIPWFNEQIGIWFPKRFVYKGKYENSICIGIIKDSKYQIIFLILSKTLDIYWIYLILGIFLYDRGG
ncbi:hypothetical protein [Spiroplasma endosymbiont of 'Nebria riversi']|uniref:hypothetical protein n=1 Tax=Spiroplasma endosymbiont of 'Nebria riversi' TaxID=2792084 RepID=UPI001C04DCDD|nr:hypothetical protein [Spiroplasma endosymbiont of 'Nebria riversi']